MSAEAGSADQPSSVTTALELRIPGEVNAIASAADSIADKLSQLQVPEEKRLEILLAVQEALANAVTHGCENDASKEVRCRLEQYANGRILIVVSDPGPGYSQPPVDPKHGDRLYHDHGRGVYLIRQLMDDVSLEHNGSEIRMWKY